MARSFAEYYDYEPKDVIVCGDSANDLAMFQHGFRGIVVGNAHSELQALQGSQVYKSPHSFAGGVLDGLNYWLRRDAESEDRETAMSNS